MIQRIYEEVEQILLKEQQDTNVVDVVVDDSEILSEFQHIRKLQRDGLL